MVDKSELVQVFKEAWHKADERGEEGHRVEAGIEAVLKRFEPDMSDDFPYGRYRLRFTVLDRDEMVKHGFVHSHSNPFAIRARLIQAADEVFDALMGSRDD